MKFLLCFFVLFFGVQGPFFHTHATEAVDCPNLAQKVFRNTSLKAKILDADGIPLEKYKGMEGYARFARDHGGAGTKSNMHSVFTNVSAILDEEAFKSLEWQQFSKTVEDFFAYPSKILDADGKPLEKYKGMEGYARFTQDHGGAGTKSNMHSVFVNVSAVLDEEAFKSLSWQKFSKNVEEFFAFKGKILNADGKPFEKYKGMEGYARFAQDYGGAGRKSYMRSVFKNASAVLDKETFESLGWQQFQKTVDEFFAFRGKILDAEGNPFEQYLGMEGYAQFAQDHGGASTKSNMHSVFVNVSAILDEETFRSLAWQQFSKTVDEFFSYRDKILDAEGNPLEKYKGMEGYAKFSQDHGGAGTKSYMASIFQNVSAVLDKEIFESLGWQQFQKTVDEFFAFRGKILDAEGNPFEQYLGMEGYAQFAQDHGGASTKSNMHSVFANVSAILDEETFRSLAWQQFSKTVDEFFSYRDKILDTEGNPLEKYLGMKGYAQFAQDYGGADKKSYMSSVFKNISAILDKKTFELLEWQHFNKTVEEFFAYRDKILDAEGNPLEKYLDMEGYAKFTQDHGGAGIQSEMSSIFINTSAVLDKKTFERLGWQYFNKTVEEFFAYRDKILDTDGNPLEKYLGMEGYVRFAQDHGGVGKKSNMLSVFSNTSAVLGGKKEMKRLGLGWKVFRGNVAQYQALIDFFKITDRVTLQGLEGQKLVADTIFVGKTKPTYDNVSVLRVELLGDREAFTHLGWSNSNF